MINNSLLIDQTLLLGIGSLRLEIVNLTGEQNV
jgi:hypothetical protein